MPAVLPHQRSEAKRWSIRKRNQKTRVETCKNRVHQNIYMQKPVENIREKAVKPIMNKKALPQTAGPHWQCSGLLAVRQSLISLSTWTASQSKDLKAITDMKIPACTRCFACSLLISIRVGDVQYLTVPNSNWLKASKQHDEIWIMASNLTRKKLQNKRNYFRRCCMPPISTNLPCNPENMAKIKLKHSVQNTCINIQLIT